MCILKKFTLLLLFCKQIFMTGERSLLSVVVLGQRHRSLRSGRPKLKAKNLLLACSTRYIPKACEKNNYGIIMERGVCNRDWEGLIWEAGTEGTEEL